MDEYNFLTFNIDQTISCIDHFSQSSLFIATPKQILLHDLSQGKTLTTCLHQLTQSKFTNQNQNQQENLHNHEEKFQEFSPIEIHYFKSKQSIASEKKQHIRGYLLVHYKMVGISTYSVHMKSSQNAFQENYKISIKFKKFIHIKFGSAFLKFSFQNSFYTQIKDNVNFNQFESLLKTDNISSNILERNIRNLENFRDLNLISKQESQYFYVFSNENQLFEMKRLCLRSDGQIEIIQTYQIDEESANLSSSTVTYIRYYEIKFEKVQQTKRYLIMAMQGGNLVFLELPKIKESLNANKEYYIQPLTTIDLKNYLTKNLKQEHLDCFVSSIGLLPQAIALINVRNYGILVLNLRNFSIESQIHLNLSNKKKVYFNDTRTLNVLTSYEKFETIKIPQQQELIDKNIKIIQISTENYKSVQKLSRIITNLLLSSPSKLKTLSIEITINKKLFIDNQKASKLQNSISLSKIKCHQIEQLNTQMIEGVTIVKEDSKQNNDERKQIQVFGHYKQSKIFYFIL